MLKTNKSITITGQSMVGDKQALFLSANISTDGSSTGNITTTITDSAAYTANKTECRKDIADFQGEVYAAQDELTPTNADTATTA
ncbi:hypothetical protein B0H39_003185 [Clostridium beijerinckii]|uniref:hypothetical protein n=1 Tax=Clostridium beijerinckii TaxID=1520 RepID=UPI0003F6DE37|nr:hypothetical protein [Clostridium beijerinckii]NOW84273.1 hypothetical protein [Clostridium beijerinckii]NOW85304.1 hypothetical protein [Clostridium beijerinckii]